MAYKDQLTPNHIDSGYLSVTSDSDSISELQTSKKVQEAQFKTPTSASIKPSEVDFYNPRATAGRIALANITEKFKQNDQGNSKSQNQNQNSEYYEKEIPDSDKMDKAYRSLSIPTISFNPKCLNTPARKASCDGLERVLESPFEQSRIYHGWLTPKNLTDKNYIDFLLELTSLSLQHIVSDILDYLSPRDLMSGMLVSRTWQKIFKSDQESNMRRIMHLKCMRAGWLDQQADKENRMVFEYNNPHRYGKRESLIDIRNIVDIMTPHPLENKASVKAPLMECFTGSRLRVKCPKCEQPAPVGSNNVAVCVKASCGYSFCKICRYEDHGIRACPNTAEDYHDYVSLAKNSTKNSKKNLRRLLSMKRD